MEQPNRPTLYSIAQEHREIVDILIQTEGELTPELEAQLDNVLRSGKDKMDAAAAVWRRLVAEAATCKDEEARYKARRAAHERDADNLRQRMLLVIDEMYGGKLKTAANTFWSQTTADSVAVVLAPDADIKQIAERDPSLVRVDIQLNKGEIQRRLKAGEDLPAEIGTDINPGTHFLNIR